MEIHTRERYGEWTRARILYRELLPSKVGWQERPQFLDGLFFQTKFDKIPSWEPSREVEAPQHEERVQLRGNGHAFEETRICSHSPKMKEFREGERTSFELT